MSVALQLRYCFVPGCRTGYRSVRKRNRENGVKNIALFKAPNDPLILKQWDTAISAGHRALRSYDSVCELHFKEEEIQRYFETKLPGGVVDKILRDRVKLRGGAVPSIFPEVSSVRSRKTSKVRKGTEATSPAPPLKSSCTARNSFSGESDEQHAVVAPSPEGIGELDDEVQTDVVPDLIDFQTLVEEAHSISLPSDMWTVGVLRGNQVIFANWSDGATVEAEKKVLIDDSLHVKVIFRKTTLSLNNIKKVHSLAEAATFLLVVDKLNICEGNGKRSNSRSGACLGYTLPRDITQKGAMSSAHCHHCQTAMRDAESSKSKNETNRELGKKGETSKTIKKSNRKGYHSQMKRRKLSTHRKIQTAEETLAIPSEGADKDLSVVMLAGDEGAWSDNEMEAEEVDIKELIPYTGWNSVSLPTPHLTSLFSPPANDRIGPPVYEVTEEASTSRKSLDAKTLVQEAHRIALPSSAWTMGVVKERHLIFASWQDGDNGVEAEKRVVIDENLKVKVILGSMILSLNDVREVHKFEDVGRYLYLVDKLNVCRGMATGRRTNSCPGYFLPGSAAGKGAGSLRCSFCQGAQEELRRIRRAKGKFGEVRAEAQGKVWKDLKKLSDLYPELRRGSKELA